MVHPQVCRTGGSQSRRPTAAIALLGTFGAAIALLGTFGAAIALLFILWLLRII